MNPYEDNTFKGEKKLLYKSNLLIERNYWLIWSLIAVFLHVLPIPKKDIFKKKIYLMESERKEQHTAGYTFNYINPINH